MRSIVIAAVATLAFASAASAAPHCVKGKPCGNSCIKATDVCHIAPAAAPHCNPAKSKPCGKTCIALDKVCHVS
jgi:hypothetical protein